MASDSRISDNMHFYDSSQKLFALKKTPDILGYCGETLFTYQILSRLTGICDEGRLLADNMDYAERSEILFGEIAKAHKTYNINNSVIKIYHIGRNKNSVFEANRYVWNGSKWKNVKLRTDMSSSAKIFSDGSGSVEFNKRFLEFAYGNNENTSRNYFHCFCDIMKDIKDPHTGGVPQLVALYNGNKFNGMYQGIIIDGVGYYQALKVSQPFSMSDVRWYNDKFEICDWNTKVKKKDAVSQPFSKKQLPDSPL